MRTSLKLLAVLFCASLCGHAQTIFDSSFNTGGISGGSYFVVTPVSGGYLFTAIPGTQSGSAMPPLVPGTYIGAPIAFTLSAPPVRTDTTMQPYPTTIPCPYSGTGCSVGNGSLVGAGYAFTPTDFTTTLVRLTDATMGSGSHGFNTSCDASSETNDFGLNKDILTLCETGNNQRIFGMDPITRALTYDASFKTPGVNSMWASFTQAYVFYHAHKNSSNDLAIFSYDFTFCHNSIATCVPAITQLVDLGVTCGIAALTGNANLNVGEGLNASGDDQSFGVLGQSQSGQGGPGAIYAIVWNRTAGCTYWNTGTGHWFVNGADQGTTSVADRFYMHNFRLSKSGAVVKVSMQPGTCQSACPAAYNYFWVIGTATVDVSLQSSKGCGHTAIGYAHFVNKCNDGINVNDLLMAPLSSVNSNVSLPYGYPRPGAANGSHIAWANDNPTDTSPFFAIFEATSFTSVYAWDNEILRVHTDGSGAVDRLAHTYATPAASPFVPGSISQDGSLIIWTTDWDGMLGNVNNFSTVCTPGADCRKDVFLAILP